jgi:hypothetical protein
VTLGRSSVISFSYPLTEVYHSVFIKNPVGTYNFGAFTEPFTYMSWIAIIISCIAVPPVVFLIIRYLIFSLFNYVKCKYLLLGKVNHLLLCMVLHWAIHMHF